MQSITFCMLTPLNPPLSDFLNIAFPFLFLDTFLYDKHRFYSNKLHNKLTSKGFLNFVALAAALLCCFIRSIKFAVTPV